jgi:hypothetical protein
MFGMVGCDWAVSQTLSAAAVIPGALLDGGREGTPFGETAVAQKALYAS